MMKPWPFVAMVAGAVMLASSPLGASTQSAVPPSSTTQAGPAPSRNAPADHYFGRLNWSVLQVRYEIQFQKKKVDYHTIAPDDALHTARFIEAAVVAWAQAYPRDSWLPQTTYALEQLLAAIPLPEAHDRATHLLQRIAARYGSTPYGKESRIALRDGVPQAAAYDLATPPPSNAGSTEMSASAAETPEAQPLAAITPPAQPSPSAK